MSALLARLRRHADDRGLMADLRCGLVATKRHRSWPALSRLNVSVNDGVASLVAGLYATHQQESNEGNLGTTCRLLQRSRGELRTGADRDSKLTPTERRFQLVLAAEEGAELHERVTRLVLLARAEGVPVNYTQLERDLRAWSEPTRTRWAAAFWTPEVESSTEGPDTGEAP